MSHDGDNLRFHAMRRAAVVLAAMVAGWFMAVGEAAADCGDYVVILNPSATAKANQRAMALGHSGNPGKPCNGPQCRGRLPGPMPVIPPVTQVVTVDQHAMLMPDADLIAPSFACMSFESVFHLSPGHLLTAEPPPRS